MDKCSTCGTNKPGLLICGGCGEGKRAFSNLLFSIQRRSLTPILLLCLLQLLIAQKTIRKKVGKKVTKENAKPTRSKFIQLTEDMWSQAAI